MAAKAVVGRVSHETAVGSTAGLVQVCCSWVHRGSSVKKYCSPCSAELPTAPSIQHSYSQAQTPIQDEGIFMGYGTLKSFKGSEYDLN